MWAPPPLLICTQMLVCCQTQRWEWKERRWTDLGPSYNRTDSHFLLACSVSLYLLHADSFKGSIHKVILSFNPVGGRADCFRFLDTPHHANTIEVSIILFVALTSSQWHLKKKTLNPYSSWLWTGSASKQADPCHSRTCLTAPFQIRPHTACVQSEVGAVIGTHSRGSDPVRNWSRSGLA